MASLKKTTVPRVAGKALRDLGIRLRTARTLRRYAQSDLAARVFVGRATIARLERGDPTVGIGVLATTLYVLGIAGELDALATADPVTLALREDALPKRVRRRHPA